MYFIVHTSALLLDTNLDYLWPSSLALVRMTTYCTWLPRAHLRVYTCKMNRNDPGGV